MTSTASGFCDECGLELTTQAIKPVTAAQIMASGEIASEGGDRTKCPYCGFKLRPNARHCFHTPSAKVMREIRETPRTS